VVICELIIDYLFGYTVSSITIAVKYIDVNIPTAIAIEWKNLRCILICYLIHVQVFYVLIPQSLRLDCI
jgi:hypothetical protein